MQDAAVDRSAIEADDRNDVYHSIVSDLVSLIEHVQESLTLTERAAGEASVTRTLPPILSCWMTSRPATRR